MHFLFTEVGAFKRTEPLGRLRMGLPRCRRNVRSKPWSSHVRHERSVRFVTLIELCEMISDSLSSSNADIRSVDLAIYASLQREEGENEGTAKTELYP